MLSAACLHCAGFPNEGPRHALGLTAFYLHRRRHLPQFDPLVLVWICLGDGQESNAGREPETFTAAKADLWSVIIGRPNADTIIGKITHIAAALVHRLRKWFCFPTVCDGGHGAEGDGCAGEEEGLGSCHDASLMYSTL